MQATMKIIQLTYDTSYGKPDFGEADLVQLLTGWHPVVYRTQPAFKEQATVIKLLEELQALNSPTIEYEPIEDASECDAGISENDDEASRKELAKRERRVAKAPKPEPAVLQNKQLSAKQQQSHETTLPNPSHVDGNGLYADLHTI